MAWWGGLNRTALQPLPLSVLSTVCVGAEPFPVAVVNGVREGVSNLRRVLKFERHGSAFGVSEKAHDSVTLERIKQIAKKATAPRIKSGIVSAMLLCVLVGALWR